ncbi:complement C1q-like protein 4 [Saccostrea cucullata]|uniref:complement C1q-like protein 4 n=1 Tax=Saccostrea cuccullata TaxID=36930 RepID=UPI002ED17FC0
MRLFLVLILLFLISCIQSKDPESSAGISSEPWSDEIRVLRMELMEMQKEMSEQKEKIKQLEDDLKKKTEKCECPQTNLREIESKEIVQTQRKDPRTSEGSTRDLPKDDKSVIRRLLIPPTPSPSSSPNISHRIAFHAYSPSDFKNLALHQSLIFGRVILNQGNQYHHTTGIFTPHVSGVYVFYVQLVVSSDGDVHTELVVEGVRKGGHFVQSHTPGGYYNGGGMTIVHVNAGDSVWVRLGTQRGTNFFGWESSFSGFLLYEEE